MSAENHKKIKILVVFGTRPEAIKLAPVCRKLKEASMFELYICNTGQQREMAEKTLSFFDLRSDYDLDVMTCSQTLPGLQARLLEKFSSLLAEENFDGIIVQGDTMSAFCGALAGFYGKIPVFHVEAGLRSSSLAEPWPEEGLRQMLTRIAVLHFASTSEAEKNLLRENIIRENIVVTGNTVIDALYSLSPEKYAEAERSLQRDHGISGEKKMVLVTVHRRENHGERLENILMAVIRLAEKYPEHVFILPVHPNPAVKEKVTGKLSSFSNIFLLPPLNYPVLCFLMKKSVLILTDSGGIQEEAPAFGTPVIVLREKTERQEGIEKGCAFLAGADCEKICLLAGKFLDGNGEKIVRENPYGDGNAAGRIVQKIMDFYTLEQK